MNGGNNYDMPGGGNRNSNNRMDTIGLSSSHYGSYGTGGTGGGIGEVESLEYSSQTDSESYIALHTAAAATSIGVGGESVTGGPVYITSPYNSTTHPDATETVHEMHLVLLYLLSHPDEFHRALANHPSRGATTLAEWNAEYDNDSHTEAESMVTADMPHAPSTPHTTTTARQQQQYQSSNTPQSHLHSHHHPSSAGSVSSTSSGGGTPLPFVIFADDAEVVLPQAHTASQLFGVERLEGIELEAAAGVPALSQLFLRWLALMPGGDHLNIIDPPGLTVMRIAGGRYRVTAAHRVVWTWMNEFAPLTDLSSNNGNNGFDRSSYNNGNSSQASSFEAVNQLQVGDLVTMTIVDVFETDNQGKLLSYCPTFDNRAVFKTYPTAETLRRSSNKLLSLLGKAQKSKLATMIMRKAKSMAWTVKQKVDEAVHSYNASPQRTRSPRGFGNDDYSGFYDGKNSRGSTGMIDGMMHAMGIGGGTNDNDLHMSQSGTTAEDGWIEESATRSTGGSGVETADAVEDDDTAEHHEV